MRHVFLTLAVLAVSLRILVPTGFMPAASEGDLPFPLVICTAQGAIALDAAVNATHERNSTGHDQTTADHPPCLFSGPATGTIASGALALISVLHIYAAPIEWIPSRIIERAAPTGPPLPARGPPRPTA